MDQYRVEFTKDEMHSLTEVLTKFRQQTADYYNNLSPSQRIPPSSDPVFRAACELQYKLAKEMNPGTDLTVEDFLSYGE